MRVFDRKKDMINRGGYKIYSVEVENALLSFPGVIEAAVVAESCPVLGERVHAFVVAGAGVQPADLKRHCAGLLADYKVPEAFTLSDTPPAAQRQWQAAQTQPAPRHECRVDRARPWRSALAPPIAVGERQL